MRKLHVFFLPLLILLLAACSGGNGGQAATASPEPVAANGFGTAQNHTHSLVILPDAQQTMVLATHYGIFRSQDHGASWQETAAGPNQLMQGLMAYWLSYNPLNPQRLYVLTQVATVPHNGTLGLYTSGDGGKTWQAIDAGLPAHGFIDPILPPVNADLPAQGFSDSTWHPKDNTVLPAPTYITTIIQVGENFFCGHTDGIYRSSDKGKTWKLVLPSLKGKMFKLSVSGNVIYAIQMENHC